MQLNYQKYIVFIKVIIKDLLLILSSLSMTDNLFTLESLIISCILFNNKIRNIIKALIDTSATNYAFINKTTAHIICKNLSINIISLSKLKLIKYFNKHLTKQSITHDICLDLTI